MRVPQWRQRPRKISHDRTGTLSNAEIACSQEGQRDPGVTSDCSLGSRYTTTFRKLPTTAPSAAATPISGAVAIGRDASPSPRRIASGLQRTDLAPGVLHDAGRPECHDAGEGVGVEADVLLAARARLEPAVAVHQHAAVDLRVAVHLDEIACARPVQVRVI